MDWGYQTQRRVRESATYLAQANDGELAQYLVRLCELPDGRWLVHLMALPWDSHVVENTFAAPEQACAAADALYGMGLDGGRWDVRRWGLAAAGDDPGRPRHRHQPRLSTAVGLTGAGVAAAACAREPSSAGSAAVRPACAGGWRAG